MEIVVMEGVGGIMVEVVESTTEVEAMALDYFAILLTGPRFLILTARIYVYLTEGV